MTSLFGKILITGGTGSFGSTMLRDLLSNSEAEEIRVFSRDESKQDLLRSEIRDPRVSFVIGDTRDSESVRLAVKGVSHVFHAAALKQVPSCEFFPMQAVATNINGSNNVLTAAVSEGVSSVVFLSTDKAVYPINAMGQTKAIMEKLVLAASRTKETETRLTITRYGNVMFSRGSVIPKFIDQVMRGEALTVTDPEMTRFLMSLEESVDLVKYAMSSGAGGETFVRKAPASRMIDLAESVNRVLGGTSGTALIGVRHGEKKFETLVAAEEMTRATDEGEYFRIPLDSRDLDYSSFYDAPNNTLGEPYDSHNTQLCQGEDLDSLLLGFPQIQSAREALKNL